jgi:HK97 gp10 family phage protein
VTVIGLPSLLASLAKRETEIVAASKEGLAAAAGVVQERWINNIVGDDLVLTGHYRDSVKVHPDEQGATVDTDAPYASFLEYGTSRQEAHYPATRAADESHAAVLDEVHDHVAKTL